MKNTMGNFNGERTDWKKGMAVPRTNEDIIWMMQ